MNRVLIITTLMFLTLGVSFYTSAQVTKWKLEKKVTAQPENLNEDYSIVGERIKQQFEYWLRKDQFEKTIEYEERLKKEGSKAFARICIDEITKEGNRGLEIELQYDADKEALLVLIKQGYIKRERGVISHDKRIVGKGYLKVSVEEAKELINRRSYYDKYNKILGVSWGLTNNNFIAAKYYIDINYDYYKNIYKQYAFNNLVSGINPIIYSTRILKINNEKLPYIEFNYNNYSKAIEEDIIAKRAAKETEQREAIAQEQRKEEEKRKAEEEQIKQEIAEKKALEQKIKEEKAENEQLFNQYLIAADTISIPEIKMLRKMTNNVLADVLKNNKEKISFYKKALSVMRNDEVQNKLDKSMVFNEEILKIMNQKQEKTKATGKLINGAIRMIPVVL